MSDYYGDVTVLIKARWRVSIVGTDKAEEIKKAVLNQEVYDITDKETLEVMEVLEIGENYEDENEEDEE
jgi:hypothetical protein